MAPTKTIYVKDADLPLWKRADVAANKWEHSDSVSSLVADALRLYFGQFGDKGGGLYVQPPDEGDVTFGEGITAILQWVGGREGWLLCMDEEVHPHDTWTIGGRLDDLEWAVESARRQMEPDKTVGQISVDMRDDTGRSWQETFTGRWLVDPDEDMRSGEPGADAGAYYGVAVTAKGRIAVYIAHVNDRWPPMLKVFPDIDRAGLPDDIAILALANLGDDATIHHSDW